MESTELICLHFLSHMTSLEMDVPCSQMICMLAIPAWLSCHDLLNFLAPCCPGIRRVRIIRDKTPNQYMALVLFRSQVKIKILIALQMDSLHHRFLKFRKRLTSVTRHSMVRLTIRLNRNIATLSMLQKLIFAETLLWVEVVSVHQ